MELYVGWVGTDNNNNKVNWLRNLRRNLKLPEVEEDEEDDKECTFLVDEDLLSRDFGGVLVLQQISMADGGKKGLQ